MNALAAAPTRLPMPHGATCTPEQWRVLVDAIFPSARTSEAVMLALDYCRARKLDPFKRSVHIVPVWNKTLRREVETVWPGISELQVTAARTGQWAGMDAPEWGPLITRTFKGQVKIDNQWEDRQAVVTFPEWCAVTVYRLIGNQRYAFVEPVYWTEAYARVGRSEMPNDMWAKRVRGQLHKNAKAASLRAAFPEEISDYTSDEMEGQEIDAGGVVIEHDTEQLSRPEPQPQISAPETPQQFRTPDPDPDPEDRAREWADRLIAKLGGLTTPAGLMRLIDSTRANRDGIRENRPDLADGVEAAFAVAYSRLIPEQQPAHGTEFIDDEIPF